MKIGAVTIGQSPRVDVTPDILPILGDKIELVQAGVLQNLGKVLSWKECRIAYLNWKNRAFH